MSVHLVDLLTDRSGQGRDKSHVIKEDSVMNVRACEDFRVLRFGIFKYPLLQFFFKKNKV